MAEKLMGAVVVSSGLTALVLLVTAIIAPTPAMYNPSRATTTEITSAYFALSPAARPKFKSCLKETLAAWTELDKPSVTNCAAKAKTLEFSSEILSLN